MDQRLPRFCHVSDSSFLSFWLALYSLDYVADSLAACTSLEEVAEHVSLDWANARKRLNVVDLDLDCAELMKLFAPGLNSPEFRNLVEQVRIGLCSTRPETEVARAEADKIRVVESHNARIAHVDDLKKFVKRDEKDTDFEMNLKTFEVVAEDTIFSAKCFIGGSSKKQQHPSGLFSSLLKELICKNSSLAMAAELSLHRLLSSDFGKFVGLDSEKPASMSRLFALLHEGGNAFCERPISSIDAFLTMAKKLQRMVLDDSKALRDYFCRRARCALDIEEIVLPLTASHDETLRQVGDANLEAASNLTCSGSRHRAHLEQAKAGLLLFHLTHLAVRMNEEELLKREISLLRYESSKAEAFVRLNECFATLQQCPAVAGAAAAAHPVAKLMQATTRAKVEEAAELSRKIPSRLELRKQLVAKMEMVAEDLMDSKSVEEMLRADVPHERISTWKRSLLKFLLDFEREYPSYRDVWEALAFAICTAIQGVEQAARGARLESDLEAVSNRDQIEILHKFLDRERCVLSIREEQEDEDESASLLVTQSLAAASNLDNDRARHLDVFRRLLDQKKTTLTYTFVSCQIDLTEREVKLFESLLRRPSDDDEAIATSHRETYLKMYRGKSVNSDSLTDAQEFDLFRCHAYALKCHAREVEDRRHAFKVQILIIN